MSLPVIKGSGMNIPVCHFPSRNRGNIVLYSSDCSYLFISGYSQEPLVDLKINFLGVKKMTYYLQLLYRVVHVSKLYKVYLHVFEIGFKKRIVRFKATEAKIS